MSAGHRITRRRFVRDAGIATVASANLFSAPAAGARRRGPPTVAVFGGGIAGLTAAHELAERGFRVTLYERSGWGGRMRSSPTPGTAFGGRRPLPGEHGIHAYFGFYRNLGDTMRRIPFASNARGVFDNLVPVPQVAYVRNGKRDLVLPVGPVEPRTVTPQQVVDLIAGVLLETDLPPAAVAHFTDRLVVHLSSCEARRRGQWDHTTWPQFIDADRYGRDYRRILSQFAQQLWASKPERSSADFVAWSLEYFLLFDVLGLGTDGAAIRLLNGPANDAFVDPWLAALRRLGVRRRLHHELTGLDMRGARIAGAHVRTPRGRMKIVADWYVCALPVERARRLWSRAILAADPALAGMHRLEVVQAPGLQFYLRKNAPIAKGGVLCIDSPWTVEYFNQAQFWKHDFASTYGDGEVRDCLSIAMLRIDTPGVRYRKPLDRHTPEEFAHEVWEQLKDALNKPGEAPRLTDDMLHSWRLGDGVFWRRGRLFSEEPVITPIVGTWQHRPDVVTGIPNLLLCGDYLKGALEIGYMEAANYNGRRAANAILDAARSRETPAPLILPYTPPEWDSLKRLDEERYRRGQPNVFDDKPGSAATRELLGRMA